MDIHSSLERIEKASKSVADLRRKIAKAEPKDPAIIKYVLAVLTYAQEHDELDLELLYEDLYRLQLSFNETIYADEESEEEVETVHTPSSVSDELSSFFFELQEGKTPEELIERLKEIQSHSKK
jgi:hypothetical protein